MLQEVLADCDLHSNIPLMVMQKYDDLFPKKIHSEKSTVI